MSEKSKNLRPRIVLLHATPVAIEPIRAAFDRAWREAELVNLLDDALSSDRTKEHLLTDELIERFVSFGKYGYRTGADAILVTCSAFGPAIEQLASELTIPVLKPNEAMFRSALSAGGNIGMLATFAPSVVTMEDEFHAFAEEAGSDARLTTLVVDDAIDLLRKGDAETHNRLVAERAPELAGCDAIMLAHFSTSRAADAVSGVVDVPVLSAPDSAVAMLRSLID